MGREIRMVPPNYEHPQVLRRNGQMGYQPMRDTSFQDAAAEWKKEFARWEAGERPDYCGEENKSLEYWEWAGSPPEKEYYRQWKDEEATWFQVWETVSEGTPVSPPFATRQELIEYLVANGDFWDQKRREEKKLGKAVFLDCEPWSRQNAEAFVNGDGWAPSLVIDSAGAVKTGIEAYADSVKQ